MNSQSIGRCQRPKGKRVKLAFQIGSVLAVCLWLLYQAKQSHERDYSGSAQNEATKDQGTGNLGRRVNAGGSSLGGESLNDEVEGGGVDGDVDEKHKVSNDSHKDLGRHEGKGSEEKTELKEKELNNADDNSDIEVKANSEAVGSEDNSLQEGKQVTMSDQEGEKDVEKDEEHVSHVNHDERGHESDAQKEPETKDFSSADDDFLVQPTERKNDSVQDHNSMVHAVHSFDDETGVPVDGNDIIESRVTETNDDGEIRLHEHMYSTSNSRSETNINTQSEEVVAR